MRCPWSPGRESPRLAGGLVVPQGRTTRVACALLIIVFECGCAGPEPPAEISGTRGERYFGPGTTTQATSSRRHAIAS